LSVSCHTEVVVGGILLWVPLVLFGS
jgi:hypothetical protein